VVIATASISDLASQQIVKDGSFEFPKNNMYPIKLTGSNFYEINELMKCIGFCAFQPPNDVFTWPPVGAPCYCDYKDGLGNWFGGWYWATSNGSPDYFHRNGLGSAKSPNVSVIFGAQPEKRYPYGYPDYNNKDSAFTGIRIGQIKPKRLNGEYEKGTFLSYKEYIQSRLLIPLVGPALYKVKFYVSKSQRRNFPIKQICAFFSDTAIVNQFPVKDTAWTVNLAYNDTEPIHYITEAQICSKDSLYQSADVNGLGGWQEISGILEVPEGITYNYVTIGNFEDDYDLSASANQYKSNWTRDNYERYYFIDNLTIIPYDSTEPEPCICKSYSYEFQIERQSLPDDSTKCCYNFQIEIPIKYTHIGHCGIRRIKIFHAQSQILDTIASYPPYVFNGTPVVNSFCIDNFDSENNKFTIQLYSDNDSLLSECTKEFKLNCLCDCNDLESMANNPSGINFYLQKVDSSSTGDCCWDIMINNTSASDSSSCKFDLSNQYLIVDSDVPSDSYDFYLDEFALTQQTPFNKTYQTPSDFILNFGESKRIGTICSKGIPAMFNEIKLNFVFSSTTSSHDSVKCATVLTQKLSCDSVESCCDTYTIVIDSVYKFPIDSSNFECGVYLKLDYKNTPDYCNFDDSLNVMVNDNYAQMVWIGSTLRLSDITQFPVPISPLILFNGYTEICVRITNLRTQELCEKCFWVFCDVIGTSGPQYDLHRDLPDNQIEPDEIKIIPNPTDNWIDIYFNSEVASECKLAIYSLMGEEMLTKTIKVREGKNSTRLSTIDLPPSQYYLKINIEGKIMTQSVMVAR